MVTCTSCGASTPATQYIDVIEIRRASNGYVVSGLYQSRGIGGGGADSQGYVTYVVQSDDPSAIGDAVAEMLKEHPITSNVRIPPARRVP